MLQVEYKVRTCMSTQITSDTRWLCWDLGHQPERNNDHGLTFYSQFLLTFMFVDHSYCGNEITAPFAQPSKTFQFPD